VSKWPRRIATSVSVDERIRKRVGRTRPTGVDPRVFAAEASAVTASSTRKSALYRRP